MAFRYNVFEHLGSVSTLRGKASPAYPTCFEELTIETLFEVSFFAVYRCLGPVFIAAMLVGTASNSLGCDVM